MDRDRDEHGLPYIGPKTIGPPASFTSIDTSIAKVGRALGDAPAGQPVRVWIGGTEIPGVHGTISASFREPSAVDAFLRAGAPDALRGLSARQSPLLDRVFAGGPLVRAPLTRRQKLRRRILASLDARFEALDRWRDRHGIGPDHSSCDG